MPSYTLKFQQKVFAQCVHEQYLNTILELVYKTHRGENIVTLTDDVITNLLSNKPALSRVGCEISGHIRPGAVVECRQPNRHSTPAYVNSTFEQ
ncbi:hypothetical protein PoB_006161700 [Plakobranchus ocellatus]|uniref:Uncharacterized protein n=1 Tax=Plakobranchus ocellatus TaxID=259542 RepID=A0AAV4CT93_9GAST|nr:hypothetical protein PoB_006161700 [Plakobranchus ocellatus]